MGSNEDDGFCDGAGAEVARCACEGAAREEPAGARALVVAAELLDARTKPPRPLRMVGMVASCWRFRIERAGLGARGRARGGEEKNIFGKFFVPG